MGRVKPCKALKVVGQAHDRTVGWFFQTSSRQSCSRKLDMVTTSAMDRSNISVDII